MRPRYSVRLLSVALAAALTVASPAQAFRMFQNFGTGRFSSGDLVTCNDPRGFAHWNIRVINWYHNPINKGAGMEQALADAMLSWWQVPNASHELWWRGHNNRGFATDGVNTILWDTNSGCSAPSCLALTAIVLNPGQVIAETDIVFNNNLTWRTDGGPFDTEATAAHELGHTLGIHHTEVTTLPRPTMFIGDFGPDGRSLEPDDHAALQCSETRYCTNSLQGRGFKFGGGRYADLTWNHFCRNAANMDVFRNGVKISTTPNNGGYRDSLVPGSAPANYQVCNAGTGECSNVVSVFFPPILPPV